MQQHNPASTSPSQPQATAALPGQPTVPGQADAEVSTHASTDQPKPKDEAQLTDEQILTQMQAIKDEEANAHPLVDSSMDLLELEAEYANGSASFRNKIRVRGSEGKEPVAQLGGTRFSDMNPYYLHQNLADTHDRMRRSRGDGKESIQCFVHSDSMSTFRLPASLTWHSF